VRRATGSRGFKYAGNLCGQRFAVFQAIRNHPQRQHFTFALASALLVP